MKVSLEQMKFLVWDFIHGQMAKNMKGNGKITKCMDMGLCYGKTKENIKEILLMIRGKVTEHFIGQTVVSIQENGKMASNMAKVFTFVRKVNAKAFGTMEKESNG